MNENHVNLFKLLHSGINRSLKSLLKGNALCVSCTFVACFYNSVRI